MMANISPAYGVYSRNISYLTEVLSHLQLFHLFRTILRGTEEKSPKKNNPFVEMKSLDYYTGIKIICSNSNRVQDTSVQYNTACNSSNKYLSLFQTDNAWEL